jgi:hypothetical protein
LRVFPFQELSGKGNQGGFFICFRILREDNRNIGGMESMELRNVGIRGGIRISEGEFLKEKGKARL